MNATSQQDMRATLGGAATAGDPADTGVVHRLLDLARWAPSGDNTQPWRFEVLGATHLVVHGSDTRTHCVYDLAGHASQLSHGALLETLRLAATGFGLRTDVVRRAGMPDDQPTYDVRLVADDQVKPSALIPFIAERSVQRKPFSPRPLRADEKQQLAACLDPGYSLRWLDGWGGRWRAAKLMFHNAKLRLTTEEAYRVHREVIEWDARFSNDRVPDQALGVDALTVRLMRWGLADWRRVQFANRWLAGTWAPRLQMDLLPGLLCGAHMVLLAERAPQSMEDQVAAGRMVQRLWLTATQLGLRHQPELTPLIFARYVRDGVPFSASPASLGLAGRLAERARQVVGDDLPRAVWIGRLGEAPNARARSLRHPLATLLGHAPGHR